jgi:hypothetical protein
MSMDSEPEIKQRTETILTTETKVFVQTVAGDTRVDQSRQTHVHRQTFDQAAVKDGLGSVCASEIDVRIAETEEKSLHGFSGGEFEGSCHFETMIAGVSLMQVECVCARVCVNTSEQVCTFTLNDTLHEADIHTHTHKLNMNTHIRASLHLHTHQYPVRG